MKYCVAYRAHALIPEIEGRLRTVYRVVDAQAPGAESAVALVTNGTMGADADLIGSLPRLEIIAVNGVGVDAVDIGAARARGIRVTSTPDVLTDDVADLAIALMLATIRRLPAADRFVREGAWDRGESFPLTRRVSGRMLGIVGLGRIGRAIATRTEPMMKEIAYHNRRPVEGAPWRYVANLEALAKDVDILILAAPATAQTQGMIGRPVLDALGPDGTLINIARGSLVDEAELVAAITEGRLGAAGLDVFADEPHVPAKLLASDRVVVQPHLGSATVEARTAMGRLVLDNLAAYFAGLPLPTRVL
ncbi:MAG TPA: 2-hydroxyacid dehydrogenase [Allosphingosinicella sp.]|nr:2-hydroxyacid dehydrogenase [Allosphingosinicella sp.]